MATMTALSTVTVGAGGAANISFSSIPQFYTDLVIKVSVRMASTYDLFYVRFNGVSTNLLGVSAQGNGSAVFAYVEAPYGRGQSSSTTSSVFSSTNIYIPNYTSSSNKTVSIDSVGENNATEAYQTFSAGLWSSSSPVTSIQLVPNGGDSFVQYSTATLYGVWNGPETLPSTPTIGTATAGIESASVTFTPTSATGVDVNYTMLSSPGSITATGTSSPITVSGLTAGTGYTFQVRANNPGGSSAYSSASNSVTPTSSNAYESIATITLTSAQAALEFTGIPQTYKHLQIRGLFRSDYSGTGAGGYLELNGNASGTYRTHAFYFTGAGSVASYGSGALSTGMYWGYDTAALSPADTFGANIADILDYTDTNKNRVVRIYSGKSTNNTGGGNQLTGGLYVSTTALTSLKIKFGGSAQWAAGTTVALYGIKG